MSERIIYNCFHTAIGQMMAACSSKGLCRLDFSASNMDRFHNWVYKTFDRPVIDKGTASILRDVEEQVNEYLERKRRSFPMELDLRGTAFQRRVWHTLLQIPYGSTLTYKEVAVYIDNPKAVRAVGQANNRNPVAIIVPCHRVIGSNGSLVGYGGGLDIKMKLLRLEGLMI